MTLNAAALVVGIDQYDDLQVPSLSGNVYSALRAVEWLVRIGVPAANICLHLSPSGDYADLAGIAPKSGRMEDILDSLEHLSAASGEQLFIFLCGHGLEVASANGGPILLAQDYGASVAKSRNNLRLDGLIYWAVRWQFPRQYLFYEACQSAAASVGQVSQVQPQDPTVLEKLPVTPSGGMLQCSSAAPGQTAWAGVGQGVLVRHVIDAIDAATSPGLAADAQEQDSILFDWRTGRRQLDLRKLFNDIIAPAITEEAGRAGNIQNPRCVPHGLAEQIATSPILDLPDTPCTSLTLEVQPQAALAAVRALRVSIQTPARALYLPLVGVPIAGKSEWQAPLSADVVATCQVVPGQGWSSVPPLRALLDQTPVTLTFNLAGGLPGPAPVPPGPQAAELINQFNIRMNWPDGTQAAPLGGAYDAIANENGLSLDAPDGISFEHHETGPDIGFDARRPELEGVAQNLANAWLKAIRGTVGNHQLSASLFPPGIDPEGKAPNFRYQLPENGAVALAGFLGDMEALTITAVGTETPLHRKSLAEIEHHPSEWIEPGAYRISIDLPWGTWSHRISVGDGVTTCELPATIGSPPLRNEWALPGRTEPPVHRLHTGVSATLTVEVPVLIAGIPGSLRIEPFSRLPLPEWDLLFAARRTDGVSEERLVALVSRSPSGASSAEWDFLMLGLAYLAYHQGHLDALRLSLAAIGRPLADGLDWRILDTWARIEEGSMDAAQRLRSILDDTSALKTVPDVLMRDGVMLLARLFTEDDRAVPQTLQTVYTQSVLAVNLQRTVDGDRNHLVPAETTDATANPHVEKVDIIKSIASVRKQDISAYESLHTQLGADRNRLPTVRIDEADEDGAGAEVDG